MQIKSLLYYIIPYHFVIYSLLLEFAIFQNGDETP